MDIKVTPLGAGQDVGRSCILVSLGGKNIMFDCGMHMGYDDARRFPDFNFISKSGNFTNAIDCIIITHFHLDHCGALPYFTEMCGYDGPIYMTHPTKAICPILLEDYRKITVERKGETNFFTSQMIKDCMKKVVGLNVHQTVQVDEELEIRAYYAGHVLGAAMFYVRVGDQSVVYTGDYNMTPDRHLGAAWIEKLRPDVLITESTYATTIRDSKRWRERDFLKRVHSCVEKGGKVLIPVFALGRAQELCILLETYWERMNLTVPIYFSAGLTEKATNYYKLFIHWTNEKIKRTFVHRNMFDFKHISTFERGLADQPGPMVLFATPGMLHAGTSLEVFKKWAPNEKNLVIIPGYCVVGTVGNKLAAGRKGSFKVDLDSRTSLEVRCKVKNLSFSAHADAKGIMQLIKMSQPANVILVHGEKGKMQSLKQRVIREFEIPCFDPPNGSTVTIKTARSVPVQISPALIRAHAKRPLPSTLTLATSSSSSSSSSTGVESEGTTQPPLKRFKWTEPSPADRALLTGVVLVKDSQAIELVDEEEAVERLDMPRHALKFSAVRSFPAFISIEALLDELYVALSKRVTAAASRDGRSIRVAGSVRISVKSENTALHTSWHYRDESLALQVLAVVDRLLHDLPASPADEPEPRDLQLPHDDNEEAEAVA